MKGITISLAFLVLVALAIGLVQPGREPPRPRPRSVEVPAQTIAPARSPEAIQALVDQLNLTTWAPEIRAQSKGRVIETLWDKLRAEKGSLTPLFELSFQDIALPSLTPPQQLPHQIIRQRFAETLSPKSPEECRDYFQSLLIEGVRLEQSEWRHERFMPLADGASQSDVRFTLHLHRPASDFRYVVRGTARIRWTRETDRRPTEIETIRVTEGELVKRGGPPPFAHVIPADVTPARDAPVLEPNLQLQDLDRNDLADIVVSRVNRVYWNQGNGQFRLSPLCDFPLTALEASIFADFTGDGLTDFLACNQRQLALFVGDQQGRFPSPPQLSSLPNPPLPNPFLMTAGDIDRDQDLDLWLAQYRSPYHEGQMPTPIYDAIDGYPASLLINDGNGSFSHRTEAAGLAPKRHRRTYSASFVDYDFDRDQDLIVISDFSGIDLYTNDGQGGFTDETDSRLPERLGFGMAHTFADFDLDEQLDLLMIGMNAPVASRLDALNLSVPHRPDYARMRSPMSYGNRLLLQRSPQFQSSPWNHQLAKTGWSWGVSSGDFDNDGDEDLYIVNGHISNASVRDYAKDFWLYDIYLGNSQPDPILDTYFQTKQNATQVAGESFGGHELNRFFLNLGTSGFIEVGYLFGVSLQEDCRNLVSGDLDGDGQLEWLTTTFESWPEPKQALHLFPNFTEEVGNWLGIHLRAGRQGPVIGARVEIETRLGRQVRVLVTGDSYRSQHANSVHFGIGDETTVERLVITWPDGRQQSVRSPAINQYHIIQAEIAPPRSN